MSYRVLSCIPPQHRTEKDKFDWMWATAKQYRPDLFVTPQEMLGGVYMMPHKKAYEREELLPKVLELCKQFKMAMTLGVVEREKGRNYERIWFLDPEKGYQGQVTKFALPRYDHVNARGYGHIVPETNFENRFKIFHLKGARVTGMFCWEVYSNILWTGLALAQPDFVVSLIKFGTMAWPKIQEGVGRQKEIAGFGIASGHDNWVERLEVASKWQVRCPIIVSTNSWDLPARSRPCCGTVKGIIDEASLYTPPQGRGAPKLAEPKVVVDEFNLGHIRGLRLNKFAYKDLTGEFPPWMLSQYTMLLKIGRIEREMIGEELIGQKRSTRIVPSKADSKKRAIPLEGPGWFDA